MSRKHSSWKNKEIVYCYILTRNLPSFSVRQLFDGQTRQWVLSPRFSLVDARLWCPTVILSLSLWYPGSGVVFDCIDS